MSACLPCACVCVCVRAHVHVFVYVMCVYVCVHIRTSPKVMISIHCLFMDQPSGVSGNCDGRHTYIAMHYYHLKSSNMSHICVLLLTVHYLCLENLSQ